MSNISTQSDSKFSKMIKKSRKVKNKINGPEDTNSNSSANLSNESMNHVVINKQMNFENFTMPSDLQMIFKTLDNINNFIQDIYEKAMDVFFNNEDELICEALINAMKPFCINKEKCKAYRYRSRVTGLCTNHSDLDIFLDLNDVYNGNHDQTSDIQRNYIDCTRHILSKYSGIWTRFDSIPRARIPLLRVFYEPTAIDCDISFKHGLGVENTKLLRFFLDFQPISRKVILFLKTWSAKFKFDRINNYALSLMVIFYLQTKRLMYSVSELRNMCKGTPKIITGWDCTFYDDLKNIKWLRCNLTCIDILLGFFQYYTSFNYNEHVICPLLGRTIQRNDFHINEDLSSLPEEMKCYKVYLQSNNDPELFQSFASLCVQDPFDLSHNITKDTTSHMVIKFSKACQISNEMLKDTLNK